MLVLVFRGGKWVENISGNRNELRNKSRTVQMPNKYSLNEMVLVRVKSFYLFIFWQWVGFLHLIVS